MQKFLGIILPFLKERVVKLALKKILGAAFAVGGFKVWIMKFLIVECWDEIAEPLIRAAAAELQEEYDEFQGKRMAAKVKHLKKGGKLEDYNDAVDDIYN